MIYPPVAAKQTFSTSSPTHSGKNWTFWLINFYKASATGLREDLGST